jgi:hypothetical protein
VTETPGYDDRSHQQTPFDEIQKVTKPTPGPAEPKDLSSDDATETNDAAGEPAASSH